MKADFKTTVAEKAQTASTGAFQKSFGPQLKKEMEYCNANPHEVSKLERVQAKVNEVKDILDQDIEKVLPRESSVLLS